MTPTSTELRRLTIVLGGGETDEQALSVMSSALAELASEVTGLFLEETDLFTLAELPLSREISRWTSRAQPLELSDLQRQVRVQASRAESALRLSAERAGLKWSFQRMSGQLSAALQASQDVELLLLSAARRMAGASAELRALSRSLGRRSGAAARPIVAVFDGSERAEQALRTAIRLASSANRQLLVLLPTGDAAVLQGLRARVSELLEERLAGLLPVPSAEIDVLLQTLRARSADLFVIAADETLLEETRLIRLRQLAGCPVLIVR